MAKQNTKKQGIKIINLSTERNAFSSLFHLFSGENQFEEVGKVRSLLSNQRARIIHIIKQGKPQSVYALAKMLGRDFKSVRKDLAILEHFGIVGLQKQGKTRESLKPVLNQDSLQISINF